MGEYITKRVIWGWAEVVLMGTTTVCSSPYGIWSPFNYGKKKPTVLVASTAPPKGDGS